MIFTQICIPTLEKNGLTSSISLHFGKTPYLAFLNEENGEIKDLEFVECNGKHAGGSLTPAEIALNSDANILICGNLGSKAINILQKHNLSVFSGAEGNVEEIFQQWKKGGLSDDHRNLCVKNSCH